MSHIPQRQEKDCLNCGTIVQGKFCQNCGQENVLPKETFWHMVVHFFYDITHFDSKFFETLKDLLFRPGFLPKEYMLGRRVKYLHPIKMYVFTSAVFFLLFFSFFSLENNLQLGPTGGMTGKKRLELIARAEKLSKGDTSKLELVRQLQVLKDTTRLLTLADISLLSGDYTVIDFSGDGNKYGTVAAYDSVQQSLPSSKRDGWFMQRLIRKEININVKYRNNPAGAMKKLGDMVLHRIPYMLFVSLPLFAFILQLVYIRRKQFYYADHGVFTIHLYVFTFLLLLLVFSLDKLEDMLQSGFMGVVIAVLVLLLFFYLYRAMRNFYGQGKAKTFFKFLIVALSSLVMMLVLFLLFLFFSAFTL